MVVFAKVNHTWLWEYIFWKDIYLSMVNDKSGVAAAVYATAS